MIELPETPRVLGSVVTTADGSLTLAHPEHGECYHSQSGALTEARALYVAASGLADAWTAYPVLNILDVGLGLGYNAVATITAWLDAPDPGPMAVRSLEIDASLVIGLASGRAPWQANWSDPELAVVQALASGPSPYFYSGHIRHPRNQSTCTWEVHIADATAQDLAAPRDGVWHFVWQDPFSPTKNPSMWSAAWFAQVLRHAAPSCSLMTYSVARQVRDALTASGWLYAKIPATMSPKRHWLRAYPASSR